MVEQGEASTLLPRPDPTTLTTQALDKEIAHLRELMDREFRLIEARRLEQKSDTKSAVDAALAAAKEAVAKTEVSTEKQLNQLGIVFSQGLDAVEKNVADIKDRVGAIESVKRGGQQAYTGIYAALGAIVLLITIVGAVIAFKSGGP